jgi:hypothetical protein
MLIDSPLKNWIRSLSRIGSFLGHSWQKILAVLGLATLVTLSGCSSSDSGGTVPPTEPVVYQQLERLAVPALNELFMPFADHDFSNRNTPTGDGNFQSTAIRNFFTAIGRSQDIADLVIAVTVPDLVNADLAQDGSSAAYFGVELAGAGVIPANFGGRTLIHDPIDVTLSVVFGDAVHGITDGAIAGLVTDNVGPGAIGNTNTFPYLGSPI